MTGNNNIGIQKLQCFSLAFYAVKKNYDLDACRKKWFDDYSISEWKEFKEYYELLNHTKSTLKVLNDNNKQLNLAMQKNIRNNMFTIDRIQVKLTSELLKQMNYAIKLLHQNTVEFAIIATGILSDDRVMFEIDNRYHLTYTGIPQDLATALQYLLKGYGFDLYKIPVANAENYQPTLQNYLNSVKDIRYDKALWNSYYFCLEDLYRSEKLDRTTYEQYKEIQGKSLYVTSLELLQLNKQIEANNEVVAGYEKELAQLQTQDKQAADFTLAVLNNLL